MASWSHEALVRYQLTAAGICYKRRVVWRDVVVQFSASSDWWFQGLCSIDGMSFIPFWACLGHFWNRLVLHGGSALLGGV